MIVGPGRALGLLPRAAALTLALGTALLASASTAAATAAVQTPGAERAAATRVLATTGSWTPAWSWRSGSRGLPNGCAPYSGRTGAGMRWSPSLVRVVGGRLRLAAGGGRAGDDLTGSGIGCKAHAQRYARVKVRVRIPQGAGLVTRIALWPSTAGRGSDWSGLTVPSADVGPAYATNGCGDEADGTEVPGRLAGAVHDYLITWSPMGFSVAVDGRDLYQDGRTFDRPRWLGISLSATDPSTARAHLVVEKVVADSWTGPVAARASGSAPGSATASTTAPAARSVTGSATRSGDVGVPTAALTTHADAALAAMLGPTHQRGALPTGGALVALGVLLGVVRCAHAARRRHPNPR